MAIFCLGGGALLDGQGIQSTSEGVDPRLEGGKQLVGGLLHGSVEQRREQGVVSTEECGDGRGVGGWGLSVRR